MRLDKIVAVGTLLIASALLVVACSQSPGNPVGPSGLSSAGVSALEDPANKESCVDGQDNDGDKLIDCADPDCAEECKEPPPPPPGPPCSPGFWKNHLDDFNDACADAAALPGDVFASCGDLLTAITCKGSDPGCTGARRQAAAAALNQVSGCTE